MFSVPVNSARNVMQTQYKHNFVRDPDHIYKKNPRRFHLHLVAERLEDRSFALEVIGGRHSKDV